MKIASRGTISPFIVMEVMKAANEREAAGGDVLHMEVGQPSTPAPAKVIAAAHKALDSERLGYTEALGLPVLRQRIARHYAEYYGVDPDPARIVVTTGSSGAFLLSFLSAFDYGDRVAMADPGYPAYRNILKALGVEPVGLPTEIDTGFQPTPEILDRVQGDLHGLLVASPANPTGTMLDADNLKALADYCEARQMWLVSDEIYHGITFERRAETALKLTPHAIVINSFSKYFSMTGWRLGWMVVPEELIRPIECLAQNMFISPPSLSQYAAIAAFDCGEELDANVARYARNRKILLEGLPKAGFDKLAPADGGFFIYADVRHLTDDSSEFCKRMLAETGVATTPGIDFDPSRGKGYLRFSFAGSTEDMQVAVDRLKAWLS